MRRPFANGKGKTLVLIISLAFNLGACLAVAVQGHGGSESARRQDHSRRHREALTERLGLSPEQEEVLAASREEFFAELHTLKEQIDAEARVMAELITALELDMGAVSAQADKVNSARNQIHQRMVQHLLGVREVLELEQLESFKEFASEILSRSGRKRPHGGKAPGHDGRDGRR